jgi:hypothetical protein
VVGLGRRRLLVNDDGISGSHARPMTNSSPAMARRINCDKCMLAS